MAAYSVGDSVYLKLEIGEFLKWMWLLLKMDMTNTGMDLGSNQFLDSPNHFEFSAI